MSTVATYPRLWAPCEVSSKRAENDPLRTELKVAKKKRHTEVEIAGMLAQAEALGEQGRTQGEIAAALGISVMTYHRWRKARRNGSMILGASETLTDAPYVEARPRRAAELQTENKRLRRLVTDLMLDKMRLEEELSRTAQASRRAKR